MTVIADASAAAGTTHAPPQPTPSSSSVVLCNGIEISALDDRLYESFTLDNQLQVLVISDAKAEKASAAMDVHVGHQSDPEELPGLAHFLEHMLFLGTEKFPDENSYKSFLSAHSGRSNASTAQMHTNYYFDVLSDHLHEALDRFAQFFIAPLFTASATEREMNAVNSENAKNLQNDHRRLYQLQKSLANPEHPFHKFGTGNIETLGTTPKAQGIDVRKALLEFHATYYSASIMKLVIYGKEDLATLKQWATTLFAAIKSTGRSFPTFGEGVVPYDATRLAREIHVAPVKDLRSIEVAWPLPSLYWQHLTKPSRILSHLMGHEGKGSILSFLKAKKWANGMSAGLTRDNEDWSLFTAKVEATEEGIQHVNEVVTAIYQYVHMLQQKAPFESWIFDETKDIALVEFRFKSKETPINYTSYLAGVMHKYPPQHVVSGGYLLYEYDADHVQRILDLLTPERMRLTVVSKHFEGSTESIERWYTTPYTERAIAPESIQLWQSVVPNDSFALPHRNEFICTDFDIVTPPENTSRGEYVLTSPELLHNDDRSRLWFKPDTHFRKPKLHMSFVFFTPVVSSTPYQAVLSGLLLRYLKDELTEYSYDAELAGMEYDISFNSRSLEVHVGGFSHKLSTLLFKILHQLQSMAQPGYAYEEAVFERLKDRTKRLYENFYLEEPYQHAMYASGLILEASKWSVDEKIEAIQQLTLADMVNHAKQLFQQLFVEAFIYGNSDASTARSILDKVVSTFFDGKNKSLQLLPSQRVKSRVVQLTDPAEYRFQRKEWNAGNVNSSICNLYQFDTESLVLRARLELFAHIFKEPCFNQLRTQEQLGYLVFSGLLRIEGVEYFRVLLQSDVANPALLDQRIELFLGKFRDEIVHMPSDSWSKHIHAVVKALREKPKRETEECSRYWREIASETYVFDRRERVAAVVESLQKSDVLELFDTYLAAGGEKRSKLSARLYGNKHELLALGSTPATSASDSSTTAFAALSLVSPAEGTPQTEPVVSIVDIDSFKRSMPLFPERSREGLAIAVAAAKL